MVRATYLNDKPEALIDRYYRKLLETDLGVEKIILFGSYARGDNKPWSDIDLAVVLRNFCKTKFETDVLLSQLASDIEPLIEPHSLRDEELSNDSTLIAVEVNKYGKLWPRPE